jgi:glutaryl-CoA dehydrogenase
MANAVFHGADPLLLDQQLTSDERMVRESAATYCQEKLAPRMLEAFRNQQTDASIFRETGALGELGLSGPTIPELVAREVERVALRQGDVTGRAYLP